MGIPGDFAMQDEMQSCTRPVAKTFTLYFDVNHSDKPAQGQDDNHLPAPPGHSGKSGLHRPIKPFNQPPCLIAT